MRKLQYHLVDVFTDKIFGGNQLAVVTNGRGVSSEVMQAIAKEFNLSETTFVLPPMDQENDYRLRIFTPFAELPTAGHPTIGTAYVLARERMINLAGEESRIKLEEGVGPIPVTIHLRDGEPDLIWMQQPLPKFGPRFEDVPVIAEMLSLPAEAIATEFPIEVVSCGNPFLFVALKSLDAIRQTRFRNDVAERFVGKEAIGVFVFTKETEFEQSDVHCRMFAPGFGVSEDPATGSANGPLGCYLVRYSVFPVRPSMNFTSEQGFEMGRPSILRIIIDHEAGEISKVQVGGTCRFVGQGFLEID